MSNRTLRINELIQRELSDILRQDYQSEAVAVTITEIRVSPDLRDARVFVSVIGDEAFAGKKLAWLRRIGNELRNELGRRIVIKYIPRFNFVSDHSTVESGRILQVLDELDAKQKAPDA
jgi:ribosome-binding factor A